MDQIGVDSATEGLSKIIVSATESVIPRKPHIRNKPYTRESGLTRVASNCEVN